MATPPFRDDERANHSSEGYNSGTPNEFGSQVVTSFAEEETGAPTVSGEGNDGASCREFTQPNSGKYFFYDMPLSEETGVWIPVSVPPMSESEHKEWAKGFHPNCGIFPEDDLEWCQFLGERELTMWDVIVEMLLAARGKVSAIASGNIPGCNLLWVSTHLLEQAWKEMGPNSC